MKKTTPCFFASVVLSLAPLTLLAGAPLEITSPMPAPEWAKLERQLLADHLPACREFYQKYYDSRGYLQCFVRWGANDGPDDAFENFNHWPELHALGASDEILQLYVKGWEGMLKQYTEAKTTEVPAGREGMYYHEFSAQSDWMHHGEGLQLFNRMGLGAPTSPHYLACAVKFAAMYMGEDPDAPNYDPKLKLIRSLQNGSRGPMLRPATPVDWVGDPFDATGFTALHGETTYAQFLEHYREYTDVVGDHFLNLVATTLPTTAYLATGNKKYKQWIVDYMDAWLERMKENHGIIPSHVALDGKVGGAEGKWWIGAYGWGFSPVNPVNGKRENRNRIPRAVVGFNNALLVTGDQKYADAWRAMMDAVNANARTVDGRKSYPTMYGADGWYGWQAKPWNVGALELWLWSMKADDQKRVEGNEWVDYLRGKKPSYPETAFRSALNSIAEHVAEFRKDQTLPEKRLADNMLDYNPAFNSTSALVELMLGGLPPSREGGLLNARVRYFDPERKRAGIAEDCGALVEKMTDDSITLTLVNLNPTKAHDIVVQAGGYGEHRFDSVETAAGKNIQLGTSDFTVHLAPGAGATFMLKMHRYVNQPTVSFPWARGNAKSGTTAN